MRITCFIEDSQYKIQNLDLLYKAGIISQEQYAWAMGYDSPDEKEPRVSLEDQFAVPDTVGF